MQRRGDHWDEGRVAEGRHARHVGCQCLVRGALAVGSGLNDLMPFVGDSCRLGLLHEVSLDLPSQDNHPADAGRSLGGML